MPLSLGFGFFLFSFIVSLIRFSVFQWKSRFVELFFRIALAAQNNSVDGSENNTDEENSKDKPDVDRHEFSTAQLIAKSLSIVFPIGS